MIPQALFTHRWSYRAWKGGGHISLCAQLCAQPSAVPYGFGQRSRHTMQWSIQSGCSLWCLCRKLLGLWDPCQLSSVFWGSWVIVVLSWPPFLSALDGALCPVSPLLCRGQVCVLLWFLKLFQFCLEYLPHAQFCPCGTGLWNLWRPCLYVGNLGYFAFSFFFAVLFCRSFNHLNPMWLSGVAQGYTSVFSVLCYCKESFLQKIAARK